jgi:hypothetical protein
MKKAMGFANLVKKSGRDPQLKRAVAGVRRKTRGKAVARAENATGIVRLLLGIASRLAKKKNARVLDEAMDAIHLLSQVSIALKENVFDRPEVKKFFSKGFRQIYSSAQELVGADLPKTKRARLTRALRSV